MEISPVKFINEKLILIDQRVLPLTYKEVEINNYKEAEFAIKDMIVRGAPAIGAAAAYGVVLAAKEFKSLEKEKFLEEVENACKVLYKARPTAVNLMWAVDKMRGVIKENSHLSPEEIYQKLIEAADKISEDDVKANKAMGDFGNELVPQNATILTHWNAGALATVGYGTALGVVRSAFYSGKNIFVYATETRARLQGSRLTGWELMTEGIPNKIIIDSAAATLIRDHKIDLIVTGADRVAANGDTANKIGTFMLSALAKVYNVPFYIAAPTSTIDFNMEDGSKIKIEERSGDELRVIEGVRILPEEMEVYNPAFDVTPHENITAIITEKGIIKPPFKENLLKLKKELNR